MMKIPLEITDILIVLRHPGKDTTRITHQNPITIVVSLYPRKRKKDILAYIGGFLEESEQTIIFVKTLKMQ